MQPEYSENTKALIAPGMTFIKANQIEHITVYKSFIMYRQRFGKTGTVFFRKPLQTVNLARKEGLRTHQ